MKVPRFSPDQLVVVLVVGFVIMVLAVWRYFVH
jgi:hypothetical protein